VYLGAKLHTEFVYWSGIHCTGWLFCKPLTGSYNKSQWDALCLRFIW